MQQSAPKQIGNARWSPGRLVVDALPVVGGIDVFEAVGVGFYEGFGFGVPGGGVGVVLVVKDDGLVEHVVGEALAGAVHCVVVLVEGGAAVGHLAVGFGDAGGDVAADLVDGFDGGGGEGGGLLVDDGLIDLEAGEHGDEGGVLGGGEFGWGEGKVGEVHEGAAAVELRLAEAALKL